MIATCGRPLILLMFLGASTFVTPRLVLTQTRPAVGTPNTEAVTRGEAWFYQRCALCHMGRIVKDDVYPPMAPSLNGALKTASPEREKLVRQQIERGSPRMPGFQHTFTPAEMEELIAYMRTL